MRKRKIFLLGILLVVMLLVMGATGCTPGQLTALEGVIQNIDTISGNVTVEMKDGTTQTFNFADVKAETIKQALGSLSIEPGDLVVIKEDENGDVQEIESRKAEIDGVIKSLGSNSVTIATEKRADITLEVTPETFIRIEDNGAIAFADLQFAQQVEARYDVTSLKALKIKIDNDVEEGEVEGVITGIDTGNQTITITTEKKGNIILWVSPDTRIRIEDKGTAVFADLLIGRQVEAKYDESNRYAQKIKVEEDNNKFDIEGTIESISSDGKSIVVNGQAIMIQGAEIEDIMIVGATVKAEVKVQPDGSVVAQNIKVGDYYNKFEIEGTIESISSDGKSIVVNGRVIIIQGAEIEGILTVGAVIEAEVIAQPDGSLFAQEIEVEDE